MSRDYRKLRVFVDADALVLNIYRATNNFPVSERFGLQSQMRRAAVSVATNIVEGCARRSQKEYLNFLNVAAGSASEIRYLASLATRLGMVSSSEGADLGTGYTKLCAQLEKLRQSLESGD